MDPSLIETVASHRSVAFDDLFEAEFPELVRMLTLMCGDRDVATASAAEAFERAFVRWRRVSRRDDPAAWIRRDAIRRTRRAVGPTRRDETTDDLLLLSQVVHGSIDPAGDLDRLRPRFTRARRRRAVRVGVAAAAVVTVALVGVTSLRHDQRNVTSRADVTTTVAPRARPVTGLAAATTSTVVSPTSRVVPLAGPGGLVVVRVDGSDVMLVSAVPAPGWAVAETRTDGGRVGVRFRLDGTPDVSKVVARVDDGQFVGQVE